MPEQIHTPLKNQHSSNLRAPCLIDQIRFIDCCKGPLSPRRRSLQHPSPTSSGRLQQMLYHFQRGRLHYLLFRPCRKARDGEKTGGPFKNPDRPPDEVYHDKLTKVTRTNFVATFIIAPRMSATLNDNSFDSGGQNTSTTKTRPPLSSFPYAVYNTHDEEPHEVGFFFCRPTYRIWISVHTTSNTLWTVRSLLDWGVGAIFVNRRFCLPYGTII